MKPLRPLKVTPDNYDKYNIKCDEWWGWLEYRVLDLFNDLNDALAEYFDGNLIDWGGRYHSFLGGFGIDPESEYGWWSRAAIDPDNLNSFIEYYLTEDEDVAERYSEVLLHIKKIQKIGEFKSRHQNIKEILQKFNDTT